MGKHGLCLFNTEHSHQSLQPKVGGFPHTSIDLIESKVLVCLSNSCLSSKSRKKKIKFKVQFIRTDV